MGRLLASLAVFFTLLLFSGCLQPNGFEEREVSSMKISSNDLVEGQEIPAEFTCDGSNISPHLGWSDFPQETKSFALAVRDPDAPMGTFEHWLVCNIPANVSSIQKAGPLPSGAREVQNDFGKASYGGPCPPSGMHNYIFKVYALDVERIDCGSKQQFFQQAEGHKIAEASLTAPYSRK